MRTATAAPVTIRRLSPAHDWRSELAGNVWQGLASDPRRIPSKYFYDARGSELFEEITRLPEYYLTRTERAILDSSAADIMRLVQPDELVELGAGSAGKTRPLIDAMLDHTPGRRYVPIDISESALEAGVRSLCEDYPELAIDGLVGDFDTDLGRVPRRGRRLVTFLGSTIGNFVEDERFEFFAKVATMLEPQDRFLLGVDLVKDVETMVSAYDDSAGVTAEFTRNILSVVNRELGADFPPAVFVHRPLWNGPRSRMEAWLEASRTIRVTISELDLIVDIEGGERIHTEVSCKFTRRGVDAELSRAGLVVEDWYTDPRGWFGLALARPLRSRAGGRHRHCWMKAVPGR